MGSGIAKSLEIFYPSVSEIHAVSSNHVDCNWYFALVGECVHSDGRQDQEHTEYCGGHLCGIVAA
jgi:hypothetical protein